MKIGIIGGDKRNYYLAKELELEKNTVYTYGVDEKTDEKTIDQLISKADILIGPIPFGKNGMINMPKKDEKILVETVIEKIKTKTLVAGSIDEKYIRENIIDIASDEEFMIKNAVATAEGVLQIALDKMDKNIEGSKILVLGYGRCGSVIAQKFERLGAFVYVTSRKEYEKEKIEKLRMKPVAIEKLKEELLANYDVIVNTVPSRILNREMLDIISKESLIIDIASNPGGVDKEYAKQMEIEVIHALGIPGIKSPKTSAKIIAGNVKKYIKNIDIYV